MRIHASVLAGVFTIAILGVGGCVPRSSRDSYERCFVAADCATSSDRCLTVVNGSNSDSMCSSSCAGTGAFCPFDWMGAAGDCRDIGTGSFNCYQACRNDSDCLSGFQCLTPGVGGAPICLPGGGSPVLSQSYEACFVAADCATSSDRCLSVVNGSASASMCSSTCSGPSAFCPRDWMGVAGDCRDIGTGSFNCYQACRTDSDCLSGLSCIVPGVGGAAVCLPGRATPTLVGAYESCTTATCDSTTQGCFGITDPGAGMINICTSSCSTDNDCPLDQRGGRGACLDLSGGSNRICIERCNSSGDCNFDAICEDTTASGFFLGVLVCIPG